MPLWNFGKTNHIVHYSSLIQPKRPSHPSYYMPSATVLHSRYGLVNYLCQSVSLTGKLSQTLQRSIMPPKSTVWFHMVGETLTFRICREVSMLMEAWCNASYCSIIWSKFSSPMVKPSEMEYTMSREYPLTELTTPHL